MVPITIDFEGRGGAAEAAVEDDVEEAGLEGKKHGRKNRRRVPMVILAGGDEYEL